MLMTDYNLAIEVFKNVLEIDPLNSEASSMLKKTQDLLKLYENKSRLMA